MLFRSGPDQSPRSAFLASCGVTDEKPTYEDHPELLSPSVILYENWTMQRHRGIRGHDTYSRRFVELLCMPRTLHSGLRGFTMTLLAGSISVQRGCLNHCEWVSPQYPVCGARWEHSPLFIPAVDRSSRIALHAIFATARVSPVLNQCPL